MNDASAGKPDKFRRYRARKKAAGLKQVRLWAFDTHAPGFQEELDRCCRAINASEDTHRVQEWLDEMTAEVWNDLP